MFHGIMAGLRFPAVKLLSTYIKPYTRTTRYSSSCNPCVKLLRRDAGFLSMATFAFANHNYHTMGSAAHTPFCSPGHVRTLSPTSSPVYLRGNLAFTSSPSVLNYRLYTSNVGGQGDKPSVPEASASSSAGASPGGDSSIIPSDWLENIKDAWNCVSDAGIYVGKKANEVSDEMTPYAQEILKSYPYLNEVVIPVGFTLSATLMAWLVMPRILRRFHKYSMQSPVAFLPGGLFGGQVQYEKSFWGALEDPFRYLITFMAFSQIGMMVAPTTIASSYIGPAWRGAVILSFVWFLQRWKTNVFTRSLTVQSISMSDREKFLTLDKVSSVGLFVLGLMALAEACGVAVQSILTVGGIGGVATAFAARDVLGNVLSGLSLQFSKPFSLGDTIKAGSIEGQVVEMGLMTTSLLNAEKLPLIVPNSLFSSQAIVNKSRAQWRVVVRKIPLQLESFEKIPQIADEIKTMLRSNSKVFLEMEDPYCFLTRIQNSFAELTLGCILKNMSKDEWYSAEQEILIQSAQIIQQHGATLANTQQDFTSC